MENPCQHTSIFVLKDTFSFVINIKLLNLLKNITYNNIYYPNSIFT